MNNAPHCQWCGSNQTFQHHSGVFTVYLWEGWSTKGNCWPFCHSFRLTTFNVCITDMWHLLKAIKTLPTFPGFLFFLHTLWLCWLIGFWCTLWFRKWVTLLHGSTTIVRPYNALIRQTACYQWQGQRTFDNLQCDCSFKWLVLLKRLNAQI